MNTGEVLRNLLRVCGFAVLLCVCVSTASLAQSTQQTRLSQHSPARSGSTASARADTASGADTTDTAAVDITAGAPVVFASDTLFRLYGSLGPFSAQQRAAAAAERIGRVAAVVESGDDSVVVRTGPIYNEILVGGLVLMTVVEADAAPLSQPRDAVTRAHAQLIEQTLLGRGYSTSIRALAIDAAYALLATLVLWLLLRLMSVSFPRLYARVSRLRGATIPGMHFQQFQIFTADRLANTLLFLSRALRVLVTLLLLYVYVPLVLSFFPWTSPLSRRIVGYAVTPVRTTAISFAAYLPNIFYIAVIVVLTRYFLKLVHAIFRAIEAGSIAFAGFYPEWAEPTYKILRVLVLAFAAVVVFPYLPGAHTDAFKGVSIFFGVLFSFGSSGAVGNITAGIVLTYTRAFRIGDRVRIGDTVGDVIEKTLLVTRVCTIKNVAVTIPNGAVLGGQVVNYSTLAAAPGVILHTTVTIGYDIPWKQVHAALIEAAHRTDGIVAEPAPFVLQTSLDDFFVSYQINGYTAAPQSMAATYSRLNSNIQDAFNEAGLEIMSPHYSALRDGNRMAIPDADLPPDYRAPSFGVALDAAAPVPQP